LTGLARVPALSVVTLALLTGCQRNVVKIDQPEPAAGDREACAATIRALPESVADEPPVSTGPARPWAAAWGSISSPIVVTCGGGMPASFDRFAACSEVNGVGWYLPEETAGRSGVDVVSTTIGRQPIVALTVPAAYPPEHLAASLADIARAIRSETALRRPCE
jgi:hypothetical protein